MTVPFQYGVQFTNIGSYDSYFINFNPVFSGSPTGTLKIQIHTTVDTIIQTVGHFNIPNDPDPPGSAFIIPSDALGNYEPVSILFPVPTLNYIGYNGSPETQGVGPHDNVGYVNWFNTRTNGDITTSGTTSSTNSLTNATNGFYVTDSGQTNFSVQWNGYYIPEVTGTYRFFCGSDDGSLLLVGGNVVVNNIQPQGFPGNRPNGSINLTAGTSYTVNIYFDQIGGQNNIQVLVSLPGSLQPTVDFGSLCTLNPSFSISFVSSTLTSITFAWVGAPPTNNLYLELNGGDIEYVIGPNQSSSGTYTATGLTAGTTYIECLWYNNVDPPSYSYNRISASTLSPFNIKIVSNALRNIQSYDGTTNSNNGVLYNGPCTSSTSLIYNNDNVSSDYIGLPIPYFNNQNIDLSVVFTDSSGKIVPASVSLMDIRLVFYLKDS